VNGGRPCFPHFKRLELEDQHPVEALTRRYPPYSDFEFASLWAWDVHGSIRWSQADDALVLRFVDYQTNRPFFTYLGRGPLPELADALLGLSASEGLGDALFMVPECSVAGLDPYRFAVDPAPEHFDYLYDLSAFVRLEGRKLHGQRNFLRRFASRYPNYGALPLDLACGRTQAAVARLWQRWEENRGGPIPNERQAYERFAASQKRFDCVATGITVDGVLVGLSVAALLGDGWCNGLFEKADVRFHGVYSALIHEASKALSERGAVRLNFEQDLGIEQLRRAKRQLRPAAFLKKYTVRRRTPGPLSSPSC
jgi:hypothetical protein